MPKKWWLWVMLLTILAAGCFGGSGRRPAQVTLTIETDGYGIVIPAVGTHKYSRGAVADLEAVQEDGHEFLHWEGKVVESDSPITKVLMDADKTVTAVFGTITTPTVHTLVVEVQGEGTVFPEPGVYEHSTGEVVEVEAIPADGHEFMRWEGEVADGTSSLTELVMDDSKTVTAIFEPVSGPTEFTLTMGIQGTGTVEPIEGRHRYTQGETVSVEAVPAEGHTFVGWIGEVADNASAATDVLMDGDKTVIAKFEAIDNPTTYTLTVEAEGEGAVVPEPGFHEYLSGLVVELEASPANGYEFMRWEGEGVAGASSTIEILMDGNKTVKAIFAAVSEPTGFTLTMEIEGQGTVTPIEGRHSYAQEETVSLEAVAAEGHTFVGWEGEVEDADSTTTEVVMDRDKTVKAIFAPVSGPTEFTLSIEVQGAGTVAPIEGTHRFPPFETVSLEAVPAEGHTFVGWEGDLEDAVSATTEVVMDADKTVLAVFEPIRYTLTVEAQGEGTVLPESGVHEYLSGSVVELEAIPADGHEFMRWEGDGATGASSVIEILMDGNKTVKAIFAAVSEPTEFTLTMEIEGQGTVTPIEGRHRYVQNETVTLVATPAEGYQFARWTGEVENTYSATTDVLMDANKTVRAIFERIEFTLTLSVLGDGMVVPEPGDHEYWSGTSVELEATANAGHEFVRWEGEVVASNLAETEVLMDKNKTVVAVFEQIIGPGPGNAAEQTDHTALGVQFYMRKAPAVAFPMGIEDSNPGTVDTAFWIAETAVTYELWHAVRQWAVDNSYAFAKLGREGSHGASGSPTFKRIEPVTMVSWHDAIVWTNALSELLGYDPVYRYGGNVIRSSNDTNACDNAVQEDRNGFRLPTTNEWELAARYKGNDSSSGAVLYDGLYWTPGSYASGATANTNNSLATQEVAWYSVNTDMTRNVGLKQRNALGLYDMTGNVWEWCFERVGFQRVARGGSFLTSDLASLQVGYATGGVATHTHYDLGFRLVRTAW